MGLDLSATYQLRGKDLGVPMKEFQPGFYAVKGRLLVDNVVITGRLSDASSNESGGVGLLGQGIGGKAPERLPPQTRVTL